MQHAALRQWGAERTTMQAAGTVAAQARMATGPEVLDWAEQRFPHWFPGPVPDRVAAPYEIYRHYPATGNYLGVAAGLVYLLGPLSGGRLSKVGTLAGFSAQALANQVAATDPQAARFLAHATLAPTEADIDAVRLTGYRAWLDRAFAQPASRGNWDFLVDRGMANDPDAALVPMGVDAQVWQRLLRAPDTLRQRVTLALSEIFVVSFDGLSGAYRQFLLAAYWDLLAAHAFGNFRTLIEQVTLSPAMGIYLSMAGNQKEDPATGRQPDENFARELMQLFTIGLYELNADGTPKRDGSGQPIETYQQETVTQLARVFTGWQLRRVPAEAGPAFVRRPMVLDPAQHSSRAVQFLGRTIPAGTPGDRALAIVLDTLFAHANVGPFIGRQLIQRLVTSNPSPPYVARVAAAFANNGEGVRGDMKAVLRAVLLDHEARSDTGLADPAFGKLREPVLRFVHWARVFKVSSASGAWNAGNTSDPATSLGQSPLRSPSVFNFFRPGYSPPNTAIAARGLQAPEFQLVNESSVAGYLNFMQTAIGGQHPDLQADYSAELPLARQPALLLDRLNLLLCAGQLGEPARQLIATAVAAMPDTTVGDRRRRVQAAVMLVMASPEYLVQR
jgi:uncharacterized protein (DUF1800 family)